MEKRFVLSRDGKEVMRGTEFEVVRYIHKNCPYSFDHALRYEGYSMKPETEPPVAGWDSCDGDGRKVGEGSL